MRRSSVEIHSRAGWKISDNGLLSGNAGSARGKDVNFNSKKKGSERSRKNDTIEDSLQRAFWSSVVYFSVLCFYCSSWHGQSSGCIFFFFFPVALFSTWQRRACVHPTPPYNTGDINSANGGKEILSSVPSRVWKAPLQSTKLPQRCAWVTRSWSHLIPISWLCEIANHLGKLSAPSCLSTLLVYVPPVPEVQ